MQSTDDNAVHMLFSFPIVVGVCCLIFQVKLGLREGQLSSETLLGDVFFTLVGKR